MGGGGGRKGGVRHRPLGDQGPPVPGTAQTLTRTQLPDPKKWHHHMNRTAPGGPLSGQLLETCQQNSSATSLFKAYHRETLPTCPPAGRVLKTSMKFLNKAREPSPTSAWALLMATSLAPWVRDPCPASQSQHPLISPITLKPAPFSVEGPASDVCAWERATSALWTQD